MVKVKTGVESVEIKQSLKHTLFVEGNSSNSFDPKVLSVLFNDINIKIEALGASFHINSTAKALYEYHPEYYFLIDRDSQSEEEVEDSWRNFPNPRTHNRIIWRKKELENYFLDPDFVTKSKWFNTNKTKNDFIKTLEKQASKQIYYDAANRVIIDIRDNLRKQWIEVFPNSSKFDTYEKALEELINLKPEFDIKKKNDAYFFKKDTLELLFEKQVKLLIGNETECKIGIGKWIDLMCGKNLFKFLVNSSLFKVIDRNENIVQGNEKIYEISKSLLELPDSDLPNDFQELKKLISLRIEIY